MLRVEARFKSSSRPARTIASEAAAAFDQIVALALRADALQQRLHGRRACDELVEIFHLRVRQIPPSRTRRRVFREASHQAFRVSKAAARHKGELNDRQLRERIRVVAPPAALSRRCRQQTQPLVIPNRRRPDTRSFSQNTDGHGWAPRRMLTMTHAETLWGAGRCERDSGHSVRRAPAVAITWIHGGE